MTPIKTMMASAAILALLTSFAVRREPLPAAAEETRFDLAWMDMSDLHKANREMLPPAPKIPHYFDPIETPERPVPPPPPPPPPPLTPVRTAQTVSTTPAHKPAYNSCARRGMHRVYYHHRYWCRK